MGEVEIKVPTPAWEEYAGDFNSMTDKEIEREVQTSQNEIDEHESWLEAVASWEAAGKPRMALA